MSDQTGEIDLGSIATTQKNQGDQIKIIVYVLSALVITLFLGFAAMFTGTAVMFIDGFRDEKNSNEALIKEVYYQNIKIETLQNQINSRQN